MQRIRLERNQFNRGSVSLCHTYVLALPIVRRASAPTRIRRIVLTWSVLFLLGFLAPQLSAQGFGRISGIVKDSSGAAVPSAKVTATAASTGKSLTVVSNDEGEFTFPSMPPTTYDLNVLAPSFNNFVQKGVQVEADQAVTINAVLEVGATSETVTVTSQAPQVDTTTGTVSQVVDSREVNE